MKKFVLLGLLALVAAGSLSADSILVEKDPNSGLYAGLGNGTYIFADSFVYTAASGATLDSIGVWLSGGSDTTPTPLTFAILADNSGSPDATNVLASSDAVSFDLTSTTFETASLTSPLTLTSGTQYWVALTTTAFAGVSGAYSVAQSDSTDGTFWYSNDSTNFTEQGTPEMAFEVFGTAVSSAPEPATWGAMLLGVGLLTARRAKRTRRS